jgi:hypothetical protein
VTLGTLVANPNVIAEPVLQPVRATSSAAPAVTIKWWRLISPGYALSAAVVWVERPIRDTHPNRSS